MNAFEAFPEGGFRITDKGGDMPPVPDEYNGERLPPAELPELMIVETEDTEFDVPFRTLVYLGMDPETGEDIWDWRETRGYGLDASDPYVWNTSGGNVDGTEPTPDEQYRGDPEKDLSFSGETGFNGFLTRGKEERAERFTNMVAWILRQTTVKNLSRGYWKFRSEVDKIYEARRVGGDPRLNAETAGKLTTSQIRMLYMLFRRRMAQLNGRP